MKKILILIVLSLALTGCTCEYTLTINNGNYKENIKIIADNASEKATLNGKWSVPIDKESYNQPGDAEAANHYDNVYEYKISNNAVTLSYDFNIKSINESSAISNCYDVVKIQTYENDIIISTDQNVKCFDKHPPLNSVRINIVTDKEELSNNADSVDGNKYTWFLTKQNSNKAINMTMKNDNTSIEPFTNNKSNGKRDYSLYIFCAVLLVCFFIGYLIFNKIKKDGNRTDV